MGKLSGRNYDISEITYEITSHASGAHFTVPKAIAEQLGSGDDRHIGLRVEADGETVFDGSPKLASGTEAYYRIKDADTHGLDKIRAHQTLKVTARRADPR